jgi:hypothetical protein
LIETKKVTSLGRKAQEYYLIKLVNLVFDKFINFFSRIIASDLDVLSIVIAIVHGM